MRPIISRRRLLAAAVGAAGATTLAACGEGQIVTKEVPVEKIVVKEVPVEKLVTVEKTVVKEVPVEKLVTVEKPVVVEVEKVVERVVTVEKPVVVEVEKIVERVVTVEAAAPRAERVEVRFATDHVSGPRGRATQWGMEKFAQKNPNIDVKVEPIGGDYWDALSIQAAAGSLAELVLWDGWLFNQWRGAGITIPINDTLDKMPGWDPDEFYWMPNIYTENGEVADHQWPPPSKLEGPQHGFNYQGWTAGFLYNITMVEEMGLGAPTEDWTWDDLLENSMRARDVETDIYGIDAIDREKMWMPLCFSAGATLLRGEGDLTFTMFDDGGDEGFQFAWDLIHTDGVAPPPEVRKQLAGEFGTVFEAGKQAYWMSGRVYTAGFGVARIKDKFEWSLGPVPKNPRTNYHGNIWGEQYHAVTNAADRRGTLEATAELGRFLGTDVQRRVAEVDRGHLPMWKPAFDSAGATAAPPQGMEWLQKYVDRPDMRHYQARLPFWVEWWLIWGPALDKAMLGETSAEEGMREAKRVAEKNQAEQVEEMRIRGWI